MHTRTHAHKHTRTHAHTHPRTHASGTRALSRAPAAQGHADSIECVKWGGEGLIYTASRDRTVKVWAAAVADRVRRAVRGCCWL